MCLAVAGCATMHTTLRYRLTVVVDTPQGIRTGSSVVEVKGYLSPAFPGPQAGGARLYAKGEATPVKLGKDKYLFAVFCWVSPPSRTFTMLTEPFRDQLPPRSPDPSAIDKSMMTEFRALADAKGVREVKPEDYPVIATFADNMDPYSIRIAPATELSKILPGYRVVRMTIEITDAPVSHNILNILPWLRQGGIGFLNPDVERNRLDRIEGSLEELPVYQLLTNTNFINNIEFTKSYKNYKLYQDKNRDGSPHPVRH